MEGVSPEPETVASDRIAFSFGPLTRARPAQTRAAWAGGSGVRGSVRQSLQIAHQRRATAVELIQAQGGVAQRDDVLDRLLVQSAVRVPCRQPLASGGGVARRQIATHGDYSQGARLHHCGL